MGRMISSTREGIQAESSTKGRERQVKARVGEVKRGMSDKARRRDHLRGRQAGEEKKEQGGKAAKK